MLWYGNSSSVWQTFFTLSVSIIVAAYATSECEGPCLRSICPAFDPSNCSHGITTDQCNCCDVCAKGLGQHCGGVDNIEGKCTEGLRCVRTEPDPSLPNSIASQLPGRCVKDNTTVTPPEESSNCTSSEDPATTEITQPTTPDIPEDCSREKCSVEFCTSETAKTRICSAKELAYSKVEDRDSCQQTSCKACFFLVEPNCDMYVCPDPPNKRCLRRYSDCIRDHYFVSATENIILKLEDPRARGARGKIICHVPQVGEISDVAGSET